MLSRGAARADRVPLLRKADQFAADELGATTVEYAIVGGLMCVCIIASLVGVTNPVTTIFDTIAALFTSI